MVADGMDLLRRAPWLAAGPGFGITLTVLACHALADGLLDRLDPRLGGRVAGG